MPIDSVTDLILHSFRTVFSNQKVLFAYEKIVETSVNNQLGFNYDSTTPKGSTPKPHQRLSNGSFERGSLI